MFMGGRGPGSLESGTLGARKIGDSAATQLIHRYIKALILGLYVHKVGSTFYVTNTKFGVIST